MRFNNRMITLTLGALVVLLSAIVVLSVQGPINTLNEIKEREKAVISKMNVIRNAELRYRQVNGDYCGSIDSLAMAGFIEDSVKYIPFSNGVKFTIKKKTVELNSKGDLNSFMECYALYDDYLRGLDEDVISDAKQKAAKKGDFPGLRFGNIEQSGDNIGNWE